MHMADALLSPAVGGGMWGVAAVAVSRAAKQLEHHDDNRQVGLMGVLGAFVFAAQMVNIAIPGTGASGHLGGGLLLAMLLGPSAALITMASILAVQALFFADGGLLAFGCNLFNLGIIPAVIVYPLLYRPLATDTLSSRRHSLVTVLSAIVALQLGSLAVVLQTELSAISSLNLATFLALMQPIHLLIGLGEGVITLWLFRFLAQQLPDALPHVTPTAHGHLRPWHGLTVLLVATIIVAGGLSSLASSAPDGLEWSLEHSLQSPSATPADQPWQQSLSRLQQQLAPWPDYRPAAAVVTPQTIAVIDPQTAVSGLVGGLVTLTLIVVSLFGLRQLRRRRLGAACGE